MRSVLAIAVLRVTGAFIAPAARTRSHSRLHAAAVVAPAKDVPKLLEKQRATVDALKELAPDFSEVALLRFALAFPTQSEASKALKDTLAWRSGAGSEIVAAAGAAYKEAFATGKWNNDPVREGAPHAKTINQYITDKNILTMSTAEGDLVYVIRASLIDDTKMMRQVSVAQLTEFLLYVKEIHALVADARSARTGRLCTVVFANDISGISQIPDRKFSQALTQSSEQYEKLYPSLAGATMIMNLPFVLQAFVGLFTPLFPQPVPVWKSQKLMSRRPPDSPVYFRTGRCRTASSSFRPRIWANSRTSRRSPAARVERYSSASSSAY